MSEFNEPTVESRIKVIERELLKTWNTTNRLVFDVGVAARQLTYKTNVISVAALIFAVVLGVETISLNIKIRSIENKRPSNADILNKMRDCEARYSQLQEQMKEYEKERIESRDQVIDIILNTKSILKDRPVASE